jgi:hypothetical protein
MERNKMELVQATFTIDEDTIFECFVAVLALPDDELREKLKEYADDTARNIHLVRQVEENSDEKLAEKNEKAKDGAFKRLMSDIDTSSNRALARITMLLDVL